MKPLALVVLLLPLTTGVDSALAQTSSAPPSATPPPSVRPDTPAAPAAVERPDAANDPAALPRGLVERTTIFGMSPAAAVIVAASLLVLVILAIVAMTRDTNTYIDLDRRE